ncbi:MAG: isoprenyl transferase [Candidatus Gastranaerophilales bacterium]|nr:isoprenyl transferase [Candidatus Gastranaerophilales bacterium]
METTLAENNKKIIDLVKKTNLQHIAIIMDGNRRWAKDRGLPSAIGHKKGVDALKKTVYACDDYGIKYLTVYAFSTENWNRKPEEVDFLMNLLGTTIKNELKELNDNGVVISFLGDLTKLSPKLQEILYNAIDVTKNNKGVHLQIAFNYGSRDEIITAAKSLAQKVQSGEIALDDITEDAISKELYTSDIPDPDLLIRTGGEIRISNYLLWQIAYSEILIVDDFWPEFDKNSLASAVEEFHNRNRRWGK